MVRIQGEIWKI